MSKVTLIGIDTAKQIFHLVGVDGANKVVWRRKVSRGQLLSVLAQRERCRVVLEACAASHHWGRCIRALGHRVDLLAAQHVTAYRQGQKNDYRDAEAIVSAAQRPASHCVAIKSEVQQAEQALHRVRSRLLSARNAAANSLRGLLAEYGVVFGNSHRALAEGARCFADTQRARDLGLVEVVHDVLEEIAQLDTRIRRYAARIEARVREDELSARLQDELKGVGVLGASALRVRVADAREFANARNFAAFLGLVPGHRGTGGKVRIGKLRKGHDPYLRTLLIHGARSVVARLGDKQDAESRWLRAIVERRGFNVACVALAHKNARQAWAIMARQAVAVH